MEIRDGLLLLGGVALGLLALRAVLDGEVRFHD